MNIVMQFEHFSLRMLNEKIIEQLTIQTQKIANTGPQFSSKIKQTEYWLTKLKGNETWTDKSGYLALVDNQENVFGIIWHFSHNIENSFEVGINITSPDYRNSKGYGSIALSHYCRYLFNTYPINRLQYNMVVDNIASEKLAKKVGFSYEGTQRHSLFIQGLWQDVKLYSLLKGEKINGTI